jgi:hypothetical protein
MVELERFQTIWRLSVAYLISTAIRLQAHFRARALTHTHTHTHADAHAFPHPHTYKQKSVILIIAFPLQQWFRERASHYTL